MNVILYESVKRTDPRARQRRIPMIHMMLDNKWTQCGKRVMDYDETTDRRPTCLRGCRDIFDAEAEERRD